MRATIQYQMEDTLSTENVEFAPVEPMLTLILQLNVHLARKIHTQTRREAATVHRVQKDHT